MFHLSRFVIYVYSIALLLVEGAKNGEEKFSGAAAKDSKDVGNDGAMDVDGGDQVWICCRCTVQNVALNTRCELCEAPRQSISCYNGTVDSVTGQHQQAEDADMRGTGDSKMQILGADAAKDESDSATTHHMFAGDTRNEDWAVWTCSNCTYNNNPSWADVCDVCDMGKRAGIAEADGSATVGEHKEKVAGGWFSRQKEKIATSWLGRKDKVATSWPCTKCSTENASSVHACTCCGALQMTVDTEMWTCPKCTLQNNNVAHVCAACLSKRNTVLPQIDNSDTIWPCPQCTFINHSGRDICEACNHHRQSSHDSHSKHQVPGTSKSNVVRQRSVFVKEQQLSEEMTAREQWIQIVNFCKVVSYCAICIM